MFESKEASSPTASAWTLQFPSNDMEEELRSVSSIRKSMNNNKRKFNDDQIRSLETMFEAESRPELRVKQQLAHKLGLQTRQVAIWFQNKRARSKSKQIERDYSTLKVRYDNLVSRFESLKKENESLLIQLQKLRKLATKTDREEYEKEDINLETNEKPDFQLQTYSSEAYMKTCKNTSEKVNNLRLESTAHDRAHGCSLTSPENGCGFESHDLLDSSSGRSQWWEF